MIKKIREKNWDHKEFIFFLMKKKNFELRAARDYAYRCDSLEHNMSVNLITETSNSESFRKIMLAIKIMCQKKYSDRGINSVYANTGVARAALRKLAQFAHGDHVVSKYPSNKYEIRSKK